MSAIRNRINDAVFLWEDGRRESAFILALISLAALSKKRYANHKDSDAFRKTFQDFRKGNLKIEFRGKLEPIENIFYEWIRCYLIHEAEIPFDVEFVEDMESGMMSIRAAGSPEYVLKIGSGWFHYLINSILNSIEVKSEK